MHSEHLSNLHPGWVVGAWLVAVAVTSAAFIAFVGVGLLPPEGPRSVAWTFLAAAVGFFAGGLFVGLRWSDAPILHGAAITFLSVVVWLVGILLLPPGLGGGGVGLSAPVVLGMILVQLTASVSGGLVGRHMVRHGEASPLD
ncbi:MAG: hypothetical protein KY453_11245 [Gemmatimonadetes bacterium]|nr:hypothetical protein [Gemmatimonadota bacterium]